MKNSNLQFIVATNDQSKNSSYQLIKFKEMIARALPNMNRDHIIRLLFHRSHESLIAIQSGSQVGGACYIVFPNQKIAELAFFVVKAERRTMGYGKIIMNKFKSVLQSKGVQYILTYGDNMALGFFRKQGFSAKVTTPRNIYYGLIKQYDSTELMQYKICPKMDYINVDSILQRQKEFLIEKLKNICLNEVKFSGDKIKIDDGTKLQRNTKDGKLKSYRIDPRKIPGVIESGWTWDEQDELSTQQVETFHSRSLKLINKIKKYPQANYFLQPVSLKEAPKYLQIIKVPMDLKTIENKIKGKIYKNEEEICKDIQLIVDNCKEYNHQSSVYYKSAFMFEKNVAPLLADYKNSGLIYARIQQEKQKRAINFKKFDKKDESTNTISNSSSKIKDDSFTD